MKNAIFIFMTLISLLMFSCEKPSDENEKLKNEGNAITIRSGIEDFTNEVEAIKSDILAKSTYQEIQTDKFLNGQLVFDQMELLFIDEEQKLFSIPKIKHSQVHSILLVHYSSQGIAYKQGHYSMFEADLAATENNFNGVEDIALFSSLFLHHEMKYNGEVSLNIVKTFISDQVQNSFSDIQTRGWCLMEVELTQESTIIDWETWLNSINPIYYAGLLETVYWSNTGVSYNPASNSKTSIQGITTSANTTVYYFWVACDDGFDQNPWNFNWTTNTDSNGSSNGSGAYDPSKWIYNGESFFETNPECLWKTILLDAEGALTTLKSNLKQNSCGIQASYIIDNMINKVGLDICESQDQFSIQDIEDGVIEALEDHAYYIIGQKICAECDGDVSCISEKERNFDALIDFHANNDIEISLLELEEVVGLDCATEQCINEILCDSNISSAALSYGLTLSEAEIDQIAANVSSCGGSVFAAEVELILSALIKHEELTNAYDLGYISDSEFDEVVEEIGYEAYLHVAEFFEIVIDETADSPISPYQWQLMMEVLREEFLPEYLDNLPDLGHLIAAYDAYNSGDYWDAIWEVLAIAVNDDELQQIINADFIDAYQDLKNDIELVTKVYDLYNSLLTTEGGELILSLMPAEWKNLPGSKLTDGNGLWWKMDNFNNLRVMERNPNSQWPSQHVDYVRFVKDGQRLDKFGNPVPPTLPGGAQNPNFQLDSHIPLAEITGELLALFFQ